jgi:hypothetical protein
MQWMKGLCDEQDLQHLEGIFPHGSSSLSSEFYSLFPDSSESSRRRRNFRYHFLIEGTSDTEESTTPRLRKSNWDNVEKDETRTTKSPDCTFALDQPVQKKVPARVAQYIVEEAMVTQK